MNRQIKKPPQIAEWLLKAIANKNNNSAIVGDLEEEYCQIIKSRGTIFANLWYWSLILISLPSFFCHHLYWSRVMFSNYLRIALRNMKKHKFYSFINIVGLAIGMACSILILLWVQDELSFDRFHKNTDNIYRLVQESEKSKSAFTPIPLSPYLSENFPEIEYSTRYSFGLGKYSIKYSDKTFVEDIGIVESSFFKIFSFPLVKGTYETAFDDPDSLVISEKMAQKYFGSEGAIGKTLQILSSDKISWLDFKVTAVMKNIPHNSHLQTSCFMSFKAITKLIEWYRLDEWTDWSVITYVQLRKDCSYLEIGKGIDDYIKKIYPNDDENTEFYLQPLSRIHLYSDYKNDLAVRGDIRYVYIFTIIAIFIFCIACINFMNLSTARSTLRAKEVGLRKTVGANRIHLVKQFFSESVLYSIFSLFLALILVEFMRPVFNQLTGKQLFIHYRDLGVIFSLLGIAVVTGILSGSYPAFVLSAFHPLQVFQRVKGSISGRGLFRKLLVVIQFSLSVIIIICTMVIFNQLGFLRNKNIGFDKQNVIYMPLSGVLSKKYSILENEILQHPNVQEVTASSQLMSNIRRHFSRMSLNGNILGNLDINYFQVNHNFTNVFNMKVLKGRGFSTDFSTDRDKSIIINESLAKLLEKEDLIGSKVRIPTMSGLSPQIIGIVEDFHYESLHSQVNPLILSFRTQELGYMYVKYAPGRISSIVEYLENIFKKHGLDSPFEFHFLDQSIDNLYFAEQRMAKIFRYFAYLAIFISCLGLFGMASFTAERRAKEISVRKVLGASISGIVVLLSRDFLKSVLIANIIAWPIAYIAMNSWLRNFAYRIDIGWWMFVLTGALALFIALLTVSFQTFRASTKNPVEALKYE